MVILPILRNFFLLISLMSLAISGAAKATDYHSADVLIDTRKLSTTPTGGGIDENIPSKFEQNYQKWKTELLTTEIGRQQWDAYAGNKNFVLKITVSKKENQGAGTGEYVWNEQGNLIGATITLGSKLGKGLPSPVYFPVMNSISNFNMPGKISDETLAATKFMHEFGHVNLTAKTNRAVFEIQNGLIPDYNRIFLSNGYKTNDERLVEIANKMGGTPVEIWANREYWGEAAAMNYLLERVKETDYFCLIVKKIHYNVATFADPYKDRFNTVFDSASEPECWK